ncbi:tetratricopeptide repeat protein [Roseateles sp. DAIF2]|uniref:tetratricopeptide repeat protein n=1 Tax=Roseateles sp. DAIF2 TaxID=2714952 RepID=UPI0018A2569A|nr:tetratricopeptide repeat protein [Roseateles sp. DAIF2]QPF73120.1 tetratricopeptide repeat protein [Roseateles sp. DAIF2]
MHARPQAGLEAALAPVGAEISMEAKALLAEARNAAFAEAAQGRLGRGLSMLHDALELQPMNHDLLSDLAALSLAAGELAQAQDYAQQALAQQPDHGPSLYTLGFALSGLGRLRRAREVLIRLGAGAPQDSLVAEAPELRPLVRVELARVEGVLAGAARGAE